MTIAQNIFLGQHDAELDAIMTAVRDRRQQMGRSKMYTLRPGDTVRFVAPVRPTYLVGLRATVLKINKSRVQIEVVEGDRVRAQRFGRGPINCPPSMLEKVEAPAPDAPRVLGVPFVER